MALEEEDRWTGYFNFAGESTSIIYGIEKFQFTHIVLFFHFVSLVLYCCQVELISHCVT